MGFSGFGTGAGHGDGFRISVDVDAGVVAVRHVDEKPNM